LEVKSKDELNTTEWQSAISELNTKDMNTILAVGVAMLCLHTERVEITKQLVSLLITLNAIKFEKIIVERYGISTKLNLIERAVVLDNLGNDLDTVLIDTPVILEAIPN
jgi:hypothetical protein